MEGMSTMNKRRRYDREFKKDAVEYLIRSGKTIKAVAAELGVERSALGYWRKAHLKALDEASGDNGVTAMKPSEVEADNRRLRKELAYVSEQRDILKKAISIFSREEQGPTRS
jgi:transposase